MLLAGQRLMLFWRVRPHCVMPFYRALTRIVTRVSSSTFSVTFFNSAHLWWQGKSNVPFRYEKLSPKWVWWWWHPERLPLYRYLAYQRPWCALLATGMHPPPHTWLWREFQMIARLYSTNHRDNSTNLIKEAYFEWNMSCGNIFK